MQPDFKYPVLLVIDMQNDFVRKGAPLEVEAAQATIPRISALAEAFRNRNFQVIYTRYVADPLYHPLSGKLKWLELTKAPVEACVVGKMRTYQDVDGERHGIEIIDELKPETNDLVVDKIYYSSFFRTDLEKMLHDIQPSSLVVVGTVTEMCVEDTARHAVHHGYQTVIAGDAVSSGNTNIALAALAAFERNYGYVLTTEQILKQLP